MWLASKGRQPNHIGHGHWTVCGEGRLSRGLYCANDPTQRTDGHGAQYRTGRDFRARVRACHSPIISVPNGSPHKQAARLREVLVVSAFKVQIVT